MNDELIQTLRKGLEENKKHLGNVYTSMLQDIIRSLKDDKANVQMIVENGFTETTINRLIDTSEIPEKTLEEAIRLSNEIIAPIVRKNNGGR